MTETIDWSAPFTQDIPCRLLLAPDGSGPSHLVVALHGMGQNAQVMERRLRPLKTAHRALLVPEGPLPFEKRVAPGHRQEGRAWYIYTGDQEAFLDSARRTTSWLLDQIDRALEHLGDPGLPVYLLGYSQGGYLASIALFDHPRRFAGLISCCSRMKTEILGSESPSPVPVLVIHGEKDPAVPCDAALESAEDLLQRGWPVSIHTHPEGQHAMLPEQWQIVHDWLTAQAL